MAFGILKNMDFRSWIYIGIMLMSMGLLFIGSSTLLQYIIPVKGFFHGFFPGIGITFTAAAIFFNLRDFFLYRATLGQKNTSNH